MRSLFLTLLVGTCCLSFAGATDAQIEQASWLDGWQPTSLARQALTQLADADQDGLDPDRYDASELAVLYDQLVSGPQADPVLAMAFEERLTKAMTTYLNHLALGRVAPHEVQARFDGAAGRSFDAALALQQAMQADDLELAVTAARPNFVLYGALRNVLQHYQALGHHPAWDQSLPIPSTRVLTNPQPYVGLSTLVSRLQVLGDLGALTEQPEIYDDALEQAIRSFQYRHGLTVDGIVGPQTLAALDVSPMQRAGQIALAMERLRWTPLQRSDRLIVVNVPGFMLYAYEVDTQGQVELSLEMRVVVGRATNHRTPIFDQDMLFIEFSPYWNIPYSIARRETIPSLRRDPDYLARQGLEFVDMNGQVSTDLTEEMLQAVLQGQWRIRQRPGDQNALGTVKFIFPNQQNIFLHHTPTSHLFDCERRDFSAGCVRVSEPFELAKFVLQGDAQWPDERIWQAMNAGQSQTIRLERPIPVVIGYSTVMVRDGTVYFYPDIYGHDVRLAQALSKQRAKP